MNVTTTSHFPKLPQLTPAQQHKIRVVTGTLSGIIHDSHCSDVEAKTVIANLFLEFGMLEQPFADREEAFKPYKSKRYRKGSSSGVR